MPFFSWFSSKSVAPKKAMLSPAVGRATAPVEATRAQQALMPPKLAGNPAENTNAVQVERKSKRHARREQLYSAIRESMTRAGMLSASYKFKVLSLDQSGNQFLVMMDVAPELITGAEKLSEIEARLVQTANVVYSITVTSVYWRCDPKAIRKAATPEPIAVATPIAYTAEDAFAKTQANPPVTRGRISADASARSALPHQPVTKPNHDQLLEAEVAAFKRALAVPALTLSSAALQAAHDADKADKLDKSRTGLRSYTLITGFEDTEMPGSPAMPALSNTQYGDLN